MASPGHWSCADLFLPVCEERSPCSSFVPHGLRSSGCLGRECGIPNTHTKFWSWISVMSCTGISQHSGFGGWRKDLAAPPLSIQATGQQGNYKLVFIASSFQILHLKGLFLLFPSVFERQQGSALGFVTSCIYNTWRCHSWWLATPKNGFVQCKKGFLLRDF